jgi:hypothetical protein
MVYDDLAAEINENGLSELSLEIIDYADWAYSSLSSLNGKFEALKSCYDCAAYQTMKGQYDLIKKNYSVIKKNIISYSDDLISLVQKMKEGQRKIVRIINETTADVNAKSNQIERL